MTPKLHLRMVAACSKQPPKGFKCYMVTTLRGVRDTKKGFKYYMYARSRGLLDHAKWHPKMASNYWPYYMGVLTPKLFVAFWAGANVGPLEAKPNGFGLSPP